MSIIVGRTGGGLEGGWTVCWGLGGITLSIIVGVLGSSGYAEPPTGTYE